MNKKKILIASLFASIMLLVPFTAVANDPGPLECNSCSESELEYIVPESIDLTGHSLSKEVLSNLKKKSNFVAGLRLFIEKYVGMELPIFDVPVMQDGKELMTVPVLDPDSVQPGEDALDRMSTDVTAGPAGPFLRFYRCMYYRIMAAIMTGIFGIAMAFCSTMLVGCLLAASALSESVRWQKKINSECLLC